MKDDAADEDRNPYAPPEADVEDVPSGLHADAERIRREHINHETSVKSIGCLFLLGGIALLMLGVGALAGGAPMDPELRGSGAAAIMGAVFVVMALIYLATAVGLQKLQPWARVLAAIFCGLSLINLPVGTIIGAYCLYLLLGAKGSMVFSTPYKHVISVTPHVKYKHSPIVIGFLVLLVAVLVIGVVAAIMK
jgi:hypothetical protein